MQIRVLSPVVQKPNSSLFVPFCGNMNPFRPEPHSPKESQMLQQLWDSFVMLIPVFFLLTMIFGAGFYIGRVSKKDSSSS
jgi:hypothetical protein